MKRTFLFLLIIVSGTLYGQHFKLTHATSRNWTLSSDTSQRGVEYRLTMTALTKMSQLSIRKIWIYDRCFTIETLSLDQSTSVSSENMTLAKGVSVKLYIKVKEVLQEDGQWEIESDECEGMAPVHQNGGKATLYYTINNIIYTLTIQDFEPIAPIVYF